MTREPEDLPSRRSSGTGISSWDRKCFPLQRQVCPRRVITRAIVVFIVRFRREAERRRALCQHLGQYFGLFPFLFLPH
jgi:hypothetical protein